MKDSGELIPMETSAARKMPAFSRMLRDRVKFGLYQGRLIYSRTYPVLILLSVPIMLLIVQQYQPDARRLFYSVFEVIFPLIGSFLFVPLLLKEQQQRTLVLTGVTQCPLWFIFFVRLALSCMFLLAFLTLLGVSLQFSPPLPKDNSLFFNGNATEIHALTVWPADLFGGPNGILAVILTVAAPVLLLGGWGTLFAHLAADVRVGYLMSFALWMVNRTAGLTLDRHVYLRYVYLFVRSAGAGDWLMPKLLQVVLGFGLFFLSGLILHKVERLLRKT